ncbi:MAG: protein kinase [Myxococcales bacterium]|nr:protein kinase [Myxococcales bacterium]
MEASTLQHGTVVDRYTVERPLGEGGMAMVFLVRHNQLGTKHALKVLTVASSAIRQRLVTEGRVQAALRHANILNVTDLITLPGGSPGLIMEFVEGPSLEQLLDRQALTLTQADALARPILQGVAEAHGQGLVHRDLKPANILLEFGNGTFVPKVADFGLAKILSGEGSGARTKTGSAMGTPHYMSPEQVRDAKNVGPEADVFALGAILYELVTRRRAFEGEDLLDIFNAVAAGQYVPPRQLVPDLPPRMENAILASLQIDPTDRPPSVEVLLEMWSDGQPLPEGPPFPSIVRSMPGAMPSHETWVDAMAGAGVSTINQVPATSSPPRRTGSGVSSISTGAAALAGGGVALMLLGLMGVAAAALVGGVLWYQSTRETTVAAVEAPTEVVAPTDGPVAATTAEPDPQASQAAVPEPAPTEAVAAAAPEPDTTHEPAQTDGPEGTDALDAEDPDASAEADTDPPPEDAQPPRTSKRWPFSEPRPSHGQFTGSQDPKERKAGVENLMRRPTEADTVLVLADLVLNDPDPEVRLVAWAGARELIAQKKGNQEQLHQLAAHVLEHGKFRFASQAARSLAHHGNDPAQLVVGLEHPTASVQLTTLRMIGVMRKRKIRYRWRSHVQPMTSSPNKKVRELATEIVRDLR